MDNIFIKTYGCSLNAADSEILAGTLKKAGFHIVSEEDAAHLIIVNTCIVKQPTQESILSYLDSLREAGKKVVVAGCMPQALPERLEDFSLIGVGQLSSIVEVVEETLNGNIVVLIAKGHSPRLNVQKVRRNSVIEIIPICSGCMGDCSYCVVKRARGHLHSYDPQAIVEHASRALRQGAKELWLTAQDTGCYGKDIGVSLPGLLKEILKISGDHRIRLGMMNPDYAIEHIDSLIPLLKSENMFRFIHIPLQSGNDTVLKKMNRRYRADDFRKVFRLLKKAMPDITIATDIICGFPGETQEQFEDSLTLIKELRPEIVNISRYWKRPYTKAATMKQIPGDVIKTRSRRMAVQFEWITFENNRSWRGWEGEVLIDEPGKEGTGTWIGRNYAYKPVILEGDYRLGQKVDVKVINTTNYDLRAIEI